MEDTSPPRRKRLRLREFDYAAAGAYFVTICVRDRRCALGCVVNNAMRLNAWGRIVEDAWYDLREHYPSIDLDAFIAMPNHVHGIIALKPVETWRKSHALPEVARGFKTFSARAVNATNPSKRFEWQRGYFDRIIRDERELMRIREYIDNNPVVWQHDSENPDRSREKPVAEAGLF